ncbi:hypothetical protein [Actinophytocola glycyrrhizae]|uniref:MucR family transcriptional regulator n=1 Tax=Actinophytocola glycyrrhizae TaxID=2044873 RepID=A0ABV9RYF8_9PSEU
MIEPTGPLPQSVYWRRRAFAAVVCALAVVLLAWLIGGLVEADDQNPVQGTANTADLGGSAATSTVGSTSDRPSAPPSSPGQDDPRGSVTASPGSEGPTSAAEAPQPTTPPVVTTTTAPPAPPTACPDPVMKVLATPAVASYPVGTRPLLKLRIVNTGPVPCTRDVSHKLREILVLGADGTRLWSSNDCYGPPDQDVRLLSPNKPVEFSVNWAGRTSEPGCPVDRETVPAGTYQVVGKLGTLTGTPTQLVLT